ncbi:MAG: GDP-mannose 4,6-dehydratase [Acidobacteriaceae bacterium]
MNITRRTAVVFGGAGFIGSNVAHQLLTHTEAKVRIFDDLSRPGVKHNLAWLKKAAGRSGRLEVVIGDVRDAEHVRRVLRDATEIYQFAAQVAVTTSVQDPRHDFETNLCGTFNVLEGARLSGNRPFLAFTSTNKVYGDMADRKVVKQGGRYAYAADTQGISEAQLLDFHSPYGCSKGAADQYVRDYSRIFDLPSVVFRMSCIAGERQFGNEDQGWVAHFLYSVLNRKPLIIYGDGHQVRDVLYVQDLVSAFEAARTNLSTTAGEIYNVGGGPANTTSLLELIASIETLTRRKAQYTFDEARPGDQVIYVSDVRKLTRDTGWSPQTSVDETLAHIYEFWRENRDAIASISDQSLEVVAAANRTPGEESLTGLGRTA